MPNPKEPLNEEEKMRLREHYTEVAKKLVTGFTREECEALLDVDGGDLPEDASLNYKEVHHILEADLQDDEVDLHDIFITAIEKKLKFSLLGMPDELDFGTFK